MTSPEAKPPGTKLLAAVRKGATAETNRLLDAGADPNSVDKYGLSALIWAARKGHPEIISLLVHRGANLQQVDIRKRTALHHAVAFKNIEAVKRLIESGMPLNSIDIYGWTALKLANTEDEYSLSRVLLEAGASGEVPDPGDLSLGIIMGGPEETPAFRAVRNLEKRAAEARRPNPWCAQGHLNVIFHLPGSISRPEFHGVRTSTFSRTRRSFAVQAAPITLPEEHVASERLFDMVREAIALADVRFRRARIEFSADKTREWLDRLQV